MGTHFEQRMSELRGWYRGALEERLGALDDALGTLLGGGDDAGAASDAIRAQARAVRDSGASYGFPGVSEAGRYVAETPAECLKPAAVGLADVLRDVVHGVEATPDRRSHGWAEQLMGPLPRPLGVELTPGPADPAVVWAALVDVLHLEADALAARLAERLGVDVADPADGPGPARFLVPPELARSLGVVPLAEDGVRVWAASPHPTDLRALVALRATTGRTPVLDVTTPEHVRTMLGGGENAPSAGRPELASTPEPGDPPIVLVVEDDPDQRLLARAVLERRGYRVLEAEDGVEGLEELARAAIDLVIVDLGMPRMDGATFLRRLRSDADHGSVPVIVLTGTGTQGTEVEVIEMGADDYLRKPLEPRLFLARVRATLRRAGARPRSP
ncbi:MAG: response regulator [Gemmatimonadota bacterium]|jgi:CheY-like chemotaxis protein